MYFAQNSIGQKQAIIHRRSSFVYPTGPPIWFIYLDLRSKQMMYFVNKVLPMVMGLFMIS